MITDRSTGYTTLADALSQSGTDSVPVSLKIVAIRDLMGRMRNDITARIAVAYVPTERSRRHDGGKRAIVERLHARYAALRGYQDPESAVVITNPPASYYLHNLKTFVSHAAHFLASTTILDPHLVQEPRGILIARRGGQLANLPTYVKRAVIAAALTGTDTVLDPTKHGHFVIACDDYAPPAAEY